VRVVKDRAGSHGKVIVAPVAMEQLASGYFRDNRSAATRASHASRPAKRRKTCAALVRRSRIA
jgi:hypothetical protein